jgi:CheY-like chemotaxis protein
MSRILVIDDNPDIRTVLRRALERSGFDVMEATNGSNGILRIRSQPFDLVIMDIVMPEKGGIETVIELRNEFPDLKIILISGQVTMDSAVLQNLTGQFGVDYVFSKPFEIPEVMGAVRCLLAPSPA